MNSDYQRLLDAAQRLKGWTGPTQIAKKLTESGYGVSAQTINNWRDRGISEPAIVPMSKIIGCRPIWLWDGSGEMVDSPTLPDELALLDAYRKAGKDVKRAYLRMAGHDDIAPSEQGAALRLAPTISRTAPKPRLPRNLSSLAGIDESNTKKSSD